MTKNGIPLFIARCVDPEVGNRVIVLLVLGDA